jgi:hypothetical protein
MRTDIERSKLLSVPELRARGWTLSAIAQFLATHDDERSNPVHKDGAPMKFYRRVRVEMIEQTKEFRAYRDWRSRPIGFPVGNSKG